MLNPMQYPRTTHTGRRLFALVICLALSSMAHAQISVHLDADRDEFLTYESIPITVSLRNVSGRNIQIEEVDGQSWLDFFVTDDRGESIPATDKTVAGGSALIPAGQTVGHRVDLVSLYQLR